MDIAICPDKKKFDRYAHTFGENLMKRQISTMFAFLIVAQIWMFMGSLPCLADSEKKKEQARYRWNFIKLDGVSFGKSQFLDRLTGFGLCRGSLYKTENGGSQWEKIYCASNPDSYNQLGYNQLGKFQFVTADEGWMLEGRNILFHTLDKGKTWLKTEFDDYSWRSLRFIDNTNGFMAGERYFRDQPEVRGAIFVTSEGGRNWTELKTGFTVDDKWRFRDIWPISSSEIWVIGDFIWKTGNFLLHSADGGKTWKQAAIDATILSEHRNSSIRFNDDGMGWILRMPARNFLFTKDRGTTWTVRNLPENIQFIDDLIFINQNEAWLASGYVYRSVDGGISWSKVFDIDSSTPYRSFYQINYLESEKTIIATGNMDIGICTLP